jgi:hypothetical protein
MIRTRMTSPRAPFLGDGLLAYVPVLLLCAVAGVQFWLNRTEKLAPWKGGGFGMFSTTDSAASRRVRIRLEGPGLDMRIPIPPKLEGAAYKAEAFPSRRRLVEIGRRAAALEGQRVGRIDRVRVEVVRIGYDSEDLHPLLYSIREVVVEIPPARP